MHAGYMERGALALALDAGAHSHDYEAAIRDFSTALSLQPNYVAARVARAQVRASEGGRPQCSLAAAAGCMHASASASAPALAWAA